MNALLLANVVGTDTRITISVMATRRSHRKILAGSGKHHHIQKYKNNKNQLHKESKRRHGEERKRQLAKHERQRQPATFSRMKFCAAYFVPIALTGYVNAFYEAGSSVNMATSKTFDSIVLQDLKVGMLSPMDLIIDLVACHHGRILCSLVRSLSKVSF